MPESSVPTPYPDVNLVLAKFHARIAEILNHQFVGMYVVGSLALGDFDPQHSDIDFIVVMNADIGDDRTGSLREMHTAFDASDSAWAAKTEAVYVTKDALRMGIPNTRLFPQIERGTTLFIAPLENGWVFQCYTLREHGLVVVGPNPRSLVEPADPRDLRSAVTAIARTWLEHARNDPSWLEWVRDRHAQVFVIQTLCRMLYSLATGMVVSKPRAVQWAQGMLIDKWARLIESALARQYVTENIADDELNTTIAFIEYTFAQSQQPPVER